MNNFIILLGQRVRSGTNFVGTTLAQHPDLVTIPLKTSLGELNLFNNDFIVSQVYNSIVSKSFGMHFKPDDEIKFLKMYGKLWFDLFKERYHIDDNKTVFIKSPDITNIQLWLKAFPESKIAVIYRDGRDNVISSVKASNDKRSKYNFATRIKKEINYFTGRSFINHTKQWSATAKNILIIKETQQLKLFKYEELVGSKTKISELLQFYNLRADEEILEQCLNAPVMGSSFGYASDGKIKPGWQPDFDKSKYNFSRKWVNWNFFKKMTFKLIAGEELINLNYEKNSKW